MGTFNEDDGSFTFTNDAGMSQTLPKNAATLTPGGMYDVAKSKFDVAPSGGGAPPPDPSLVTDMGAAPGVSLGAPPPSVPGAPAMAAPAALPNQAMVGPPTTAMIPNPQPALADPASSMKMPTMQYGTEKENSTTTKRMSPNAQAAMEEQGVAESNLLKSTQEALTVKQGVDTARATAEMNTLDAQNQEIAGRAQLQKAEYDRRMEDIKAAESKYDNMSIDSDRLFGDKGTGSKLLAVIGMSLGALGGGLAGRDFGVNQIIFKAIENDIDAQKAAMAKAKDVVGQKRGGLSDFLQASRDAEAAKALEYARQLKVVEKAYDAIGASTGDAEIKAKIDAQKAGIAEKRTSLITQAESTVNTSTTKSMPLKGSIGEGLSDAAIGQQRNSAQAVGLIRELRELKKQVPTGWISGRWNDLKSAAGWSDEKLAKFQAALTTLQGRMTKELFGGQASENDLKIAMKAIPAGKLGDSEFNAAIDRLETNSLKGMETVANTERLNGKRYIAPDEYLREYAPVSGFDFKSTGK